MTRYRALLARFPPFCNDDIRRSEGLMWPTKPFTGLSRILGTEFAAMGGTVILDARDTLADEGFAAQHGWAGIHLGLGNGRRDGFMIMAVTFHHMPAGTGKTS